MDEQTELLALIDQSVVAYLAATDLSVRDDALFTLAELHGRLCGLGRRRATLMRRAERIAVSSVKSN